MHLPAENSIELPPTNELVIDDGELAALSDADVLELLPGWVRRAASPLRDAVVRATRRFWCRVQARIGRPLGALQSPRNAGGLRLEEHGAMRQRPAAPDEGEAAYRARLLMRPALVTPSALRGAIVDAVRARHPVAPVVFEPATEGFFVQAEELAADPDAWLCFAQPEGGPLLFAVMPDNDVRAGVWVPPEEEVTRPVFVVLLDGALDGFDGVWTVLSEDATAPATAEDFVGEEPPPTGWDAGFLASEELSLEALVLREAESRRGGGVVWWLHIVSNLGGAF